LILASGIACPPLLLLDLFTYCDVMFQLSLDGPLNVDVVVVVVVVVNRVDGVLDSLAVGL